MSVLISVIIPTLNERAHIEQLINSIDQRDDIEKEILIVDGGSDDGTPEKVLELAAIRPNLQLIHNPERYVSQGFNRAFHKSSGRYVSLVGAHATYPPRYFSKCVEAIESGACDAAGGFLVQRGKTTMGKAIGRAMSSKFGVGDTHFRTTRKRMYVDSVAFAVYDRKIFDTVGLLDEALVRNQDDEFHYRLNQAGFKMLMLPELEVIYYVRDSLSKLFSQYYQYGLYKPLVLKKVKSGMRWRHLIPASFLVYLFSLPLVLWLWWWVLPLCFYLVLCLYFSVRGLAPWSVRVRMPLVFPTLHIAYGWGFLMGLARWSSTQ